MKHGALAGLVMLSMLAIPSARAQEPPDPVALYQQHCAQCHGADLDGGMAGGFLDGVWQYGTGPGYIFANTKHGITHMGMPAYESVLNDEEVSALVAYLLDAEKTAGVVKPPPPEQTQSQEYEIKIDQWVTGLEIPWAIAFPDPDTAVVTERPGPVRVVRGGVLDPEPVRGTPEVLHEGQGGMLDVAVDPDYAENGWVYLSYSHALPVAQGADRPAAMTRIVRGRIRDGAWTDEQVVYEAPHETYLTTRHHYGCRIVFDPEGYLYFAIGERGIQDHAQDPSRPNGKVHRIRPDGSVPADNPYADTPGALPTLYTLGNRNIQGMSVHPETGRVWSTEHGPMGGDELNLIAPGVNYGWPVITYGRNYNGTVITEKTAAPGMAQPNLVWRPSIAVCGLAFHQGELFPKWNNKLLVGALRYEEVSLLTIVDDRVIHQETIIKNQGRVRDVKVGPDGAVYVVLNDPGTILRLTPLGERSY
jgi:aldose sugar dehydrogenase